MTKDFEPVDLASLGLAADRRAGVLDIEEHQGRAHESEVELYLDPVCPYSYLAFDALMRIVDETKLAARMRPLLLAGADPSLSKAEARMHAQRLEAGWPSLRRMAANRFGLTLEAVPWGARGTAALAVLLWAGECAPEDELALWRAIFEARFQKGQDIDEPAVVRAIVATCCRVREQETEPRLEADLEDAIAALRRDARARSVTAVPTFIFSGGHAVVGAQPESVLRETLAQLRLARSLERTAGTEARGEEGDDVGRSS